MLFQIRRQIPRAARRFVVWCLLVAIPVFGFSGTLVELLGANHIHRVVAAVSVANADPMNGWVDMRRASAAATQPAVQPHSHSLFARHHHDRDDTSVIALDGAMQDQASDDGGAPAGSLSHVLALTNVARVAPPSFTLYVWLDAAAPAVMHWIADGPLRPPKT